MHPGGYILILIFVGLLVISLKNRKQGRQALKDMEIMNEANQKLYRARDLVIDEATFIDFLSALHDDRMSDIQHEKLNPSSPYGPSHNGWENGSIEGFLEAATEWARTTKDESSLRKKPEDSWRRCADILLMGKLYE